MDPYTTSASLSMNPNQPISMRPAASTSSTEADLHPTHVYRIASLIVHFGSHSNGHYLSYRRRPRSSRYRHQLSEDWFRISDEDIDRANLAEVLEANPFMLFYERVEGARPALNGHTLPEDRPGSGILEAWEFAKFSAS